MSYISGRQGLSAELFKYFSNARGQIFNYIKKKLDRKQPVEFLIIEHNFLKNQT